MKKFGSAVILAGGKSSRMGFDKSKIKIQGRYIIDVIADQLAPRFDQIIISSNETVNSERSGLEYCADIHPGLGPLAGIYAGLKKSQSEYVYFTACDMPKVSLDYIDLMMQEVLTCQAEACVTETLSGIEPFNAFYSTKLIPILNQRLAKHKLGLRKFIATINCRIVKTESLPETETEYIFTNLNTPQDVINFNNLIKEQQ
jgi:molybdopterin-guanine dinucleotide biosynthesis protein A